MNNVSLQQLVKHLGAAYCAYWRRAAPSSPISSHYLCASTPRADLILRARLARLADVDDKDRACPGPAARTRAQQTVLSRSALPKQVAEDEADDTSNEQFYSAADDKGSMSDYSDDSLEDIISLSAPELPQSPSGVMPSLTSATPRAGGRRTVGIRTPGSVASNFTSATMRPGRGGGKTFKVEGLLQRIPNEVLHFRPRNDEDVHSYVFVDIAPSPRSDASPAIGLESNLPRSPS
ncbi:hypothetical protein DTO027I6_10007 [Penicillium roqueforti]|nr:hypothetical protein DTO027I6_10007 [Penicillium roqueforti]